MPQPKEIKAVEDKRILQFFNIVGPDIRWIDGCSDEGLAGPERSHP